ncbi:MAG: FAD:protein FMN transferase [Oscillospiraceae bacterium]|nr:FAD:protein FMN transferase [Oscillospiraceae bacterium]
MKHRLAAAAAALLLLMTAGCGESSAQDDTLHSADIFAMDTYMSLKAYGAGGAEAISEAEARIAALEHTLSVTDSQSDLWALNHAEGCPVTVSADTAQILDTAAQVSDESGGALCISLYPVLQAWGFTTGSYQVPSGAQIAGLLSLADDSKIVRNGTEISVPAGMQLDLGALAKGYTGDCVTGIMRAHGVSSAIISLGGNVQAIGKKPDGSLWRVGITNPMQPEINLGVVEIENKAVITSGNYERYFTDDAGNRYWHILDPADGYPADNGLISVTVIGESGLRCDALSTALYVEGTALAAEHWRRSGDFEMILVTDTGRLLVTEGIAPHFTNQSELPCEVLKREET